MIRTTSDRAGGTDSVSGGSPGDPIRQHLLNLVFRAFGITEEDLPPAAPATTFVPPPAIWTRIHDDGWYVETVDQAGKPIVFAGSRDDVAVDLALASMPPDDLSEESPDQ